MIYYNLGSKKCKINFEDFLCLTFKGEKLYKSSFESFPKFYEFIDKNLKDISHMLFDNYEYFLENRVLHNLYGAAYIRISEKSEFSGGAQILHFYINGKLVHDKLDGRGCKSLDNFQNENIFFYKELTGKSGYDINGKRYHRKEGVDYIKTPINLEHRIKIDQRKRKLEKLK